MPGFEAIGGSDRYLGEAFQDKIFFKAKAVSGMLSPLRDNSILDIKNNKCKKPAPASRQDARPTAELHSWFAFLSIFYIRTQNSKLKTYTNSV